MNNQNVLRGISQPSLSEDEKKYTQSVYSLYNDVYKPHTNKVYWIINGGQIEAWWKHFEWTGKYLESRLREIEKANLPKEWHNYIENLIPNLEDSEKTRLSKQQTRQLFQKEGILGLSEIKDENDSYNLLRFLKEFDISNTMLVELEKIRKRFANEYEEINKIRNNFVLEKVKNNESVTFYDKYNYFWKIIRDDSDEHNRLCFLKNFSQEENNFSWDTCDSRNIDLIKIFDKI